MSEKHLPYIGGNFDCIVFNGDGSTWVREQSGTRYAELFGTPERAARTWIEHCSVLRCADCPICHDEHGATCEIPGDCIWDEEHGYDALLEWFKGDA